MRYRLLWVSQLALHDTSAGAAVQWLTMLRCLKRLYGQELEIHALCATCSEAGRGKAGLMKEIQRLGRISGPAGVWHFVEQGISFEYTSCTSTEVMDFTEREGRRLYVQYLRQISEFRPDAVIGYGGELVPCLLRSDAAQRGLSVIYCLSNVSHQNYAFPGCQAVLTDSRATADFYARRYGINATAVGPFIDPARVMAPPGHDRGTYVTMVNPVSYKGVGILVRLAELAAREAPQLKFQVVESRGNFAEELGKLYDMGPGEQRLYPFRRKPPGNIRVLQHTRDMGSVYAQTAVLLVPSLCLESWGLVASEALLNGIPVLCSTQGGLPEAAGVAEGAGAALEIPPSCRADYYRLPSTAEIRPWLAQLQQLLQSDRSAACARAAARQTAEQSAARVWEVLWPLLRRRAGRRVSLPRSGVNINDGAMPQSTHQAEAPAKTGGTAAAGRRGRKAR